MANIYQQHDNLIQLVTLKPTGKEIKTNTSKSLNASFLVRQTENILLEENARPLKLGFLNNDKQKSHSTNISTISGRRHDTEHETNSNLITSNYTSNLIEIEILSSTKNSEVLQTYIPKINTTPKLLSNQEEDSSEINTHSVNGIVSSTMKDADKDLGNGTISGISTPKCTLKNSIKVNKPTDGDENVQEKFYNDVILENIDETPEINIDSILDDIDVDEIVEALKESDEIKSNKSKKILTENNNDLLKSQKVFDANKVSKTIPVGLRCSKVTNKPLNIHKIKKSVQRKLIADNKTKCECVDITKTDIKCHSTLSLQVKRKHQRQINKIRKLPIAKPKISPQREGINKYDKCLTHNSEAIKNENVIRKAKSVQNYKSGINNTKESNEYAGSADKLNLETPKDISQLKEFQNKCHFKNELDGPYFKKSNNYKRNSRVTTLHENIIEKLLFKKMSLNEKLTNRVKKKRKKDSTKVKLESLTDKQEKLETALNQNIITANIPSKKKKQDGLKQPAEMEKRKILANHSTLKVPNSNKTKYGSIINSKISLINYTIPKKKTKNVDGVSTLNKEESTQNNNDVKLDMLKKQQISLNNCKTDKISIKRKCDSGSSLTRTLNNTNNTNVLYTEDNKKIRILDSTKDTNEHETSPREYCELSLIQKEVGNIVSASNRKLIVDAKEFIDTNKNEDKLINSYATENKTNLKRETVDNKNHTKCERKKPSIIIVDKYSDKKFNYQQIKKSLKIISQSIIDKGTISIKEKIKNNKPLTHEHGGVLTVNDVSCALEQYETDKTQENQKNVQKLHVDNKNNGNDRKKYAKKLADKNCQQMKKKLLKINSKSIINEETISNTDRVKTYNKPLLHEQGGELKLNNNSRNKSSHLETNQKCLKTNKQITIQTSLNCENDIKQKNIPLNSTIKQLDYISKRDNKEINRESKLSYVSSQNSPTNTSSNPSSDNNVLKATPINKETKIDVCEKLQHCLDIKHTSTIVTVEEKKLETEVTANHNIRKQCSKYNTSTNSPIMESIKNVSKNENISKDVDMQRRECTANNALYNNYDLGKSGFEKHNNSKVLYLAKNRDAISVKQHSNIGKCKQHNPVTENFNHLDCNLSTNTPSETETNLKTSYDEQVKKDSNLAMTRYSFKDKIKQQFKLYQKENEDNLRYASDELYNKLCNIHDDKEDNKILDKSSIVSVKSIFEHKFSNKQHDFQNNDKNNSSINDTKETANENECSSVNYTNEITNENERQKNNEHWVKDDKIVENKTTCEGAITEYKCRNYEKQKENAKKFSYASDDLYNKLCNIHNDKEDNILDKTLDKNTIVSVKCINKNKYSNNENTTSVELSGTQEKAHLMEANKLQNTINLDTIKIKDVHAKNNKLEGDNTQVNDNTIKYNEIIDEKQSKKYINNTYNVDTFVSNKHLQDGGNYKSEINCVNETDACNDETNILTEVLNIKSKTLNNVINKEVCHSMNVNSDHVNYKLTEIQRKNKCETTAETRKNEIVKECCTLPSAKNEKNTCFNVCSKMPFKNSFLNRFFIKSLSINYNIQKELHVGSYSTILKVVDKQERSPCAIKVLHKKFLPYRKKYLNIIKLIQDSDNGVFNCLKVIDIFTLISHCCIAMNYYPFNLKSALENNNEGFNINHVQVLSLQLLNALLLLRLEELLHRDIKPEHLLLSEDYSTLKLTGFEQTTKESEGKATGYSMSLNYTAPEVFIGLKNGYAADIWAAACVMFYMATRSVLFQGSTSCAVVDSITQLMGVPNKDAVLTGQFSHYFFEMQGNNVVLSNKIKSKQSYKTIQERVEEVKPGNKDEILLSQFCDLLKDMLVVDHEKRVNIELACSNPFVFK